MYTRMISFNGRDIKVCGYCLIMNVWVLNDANILFKVNVIACKPIEREKNSAEKGKHPTVCDLMHAFCIDEKVGDLFLVTGDLLLVIGLTDSSSKHCLLLRSRTVPGMNVVGKDLRSQVM